VGVLDIHLPKPHGLAERLQVDLHTRGSKLRLQSVDIPEVEVQPPPPTRSPENDETMIPSHAVRDPCRKRIRDLAMESRSGISFTSSCPTSQQRVIYE
jgi:hypothetical protein